MLKIQHVLSSFVVLCVASVFASCGSGESVAAQFEPSSGSLRFVVQPQDGGFQSPLTVTVQIVDENGNKLPIEILMGVEVETPHAADPILTGNLLKPSVDGEATFDDLQIDASGTFRLVARAHQGPPEVFSEPFTYQGPPKRLAFAPIAPGQATVPMNPITVRVTDKNGNLVTTGSYDVTLDVLENPSRMLVVASGSAGASGQYYYLEPFSGAFAQIFNQQPVELRGMTYNANNQQMYASDDFDLYRIDPVSGATTHIGEHIPGSMGLGPFPQGMTVTTNGIIYMGDRNGATIYSVGPTTGEVGILGDITIPGFDVTRCIALATHPITDVIWAIALLDISVDNHDRYVINFDPDTLEGEVQAGLSGIAFSGIEFYPDGTLFGITGDGSTLLPNTVWDFDFVNLIVNPLWTLPTSAGFGETMTAVPGGWTGTTMATTSGGIATFNDLTFARPGAGFRIVVKAGAHENIEDGISLPFTVIPEP